MKKQLQRFFLLFCITIGYINTNAQSRRTVNGALSVSPSGAATYQIGFELPSFVLDIFPKIGLNYSSQAMNGIAGYGWNISGLSSITRVPSTVLHDGYAKEVNFNDDRFALDGQRLLLKTGTYGTDGAEYQTENFSNLKIVSVGTSTYGNNYGPEYFVVYHPDGSKYWYGVSENSFSILEWALAKIEDNNGNLVELNYNETTSSYAEGGCQLSSIVDVKGNISVDFEYETGRTDYSYYGSKRFGNIGLLKEVSINTGTNNLFRSYSLTHDNTDTYYQRLVSLTEENSNGVFTKPIEFTYDDSSFNPTKSDEYVSFNSQLDLSLNKIASGDFTGNKKSDFCIYQENTSGVSIKQARVIYPNTPAEYVSYATTSYINLGLQNEIEYVFASNILDSNNKYLDKNALTIMTDSDSEFTYNAYLYSENSYNFELVSNDKKLSKPTKYVHFGGAFIPFGVSAPKKHLSGDFNGDGIIDAVSIFEGHWDYTSNYYDSKVVFVDQNPNITSGYSKTVGDLGIIEEETTQYLTGDVNGDGKTDIILKKEDNLEVWTLNNNLELTLLVNYSDISSVNNAPFLSGDFNGDGKLDFLTWDGGFWRFYFYDGNSSFSSNTLHNIFDYEVSYFDGTTNYYYNYAAKDIDNDGKTDLIKRATNSQNGAEVVYSFSRFIHSNIYLTSTYTMPSNSPTVGGGSGLFVSSDFVSHETGIAFIETPNLGLSQVEVIDFNYDHKTNTTLTKVENNSHTTDIEYESYFDDTEYSDLKYPYKALSQVPNAKLVSKVTETFDYISKTRFKEFKYYGATMHAQGLGFVGFRKVAQSNWQGDNIATLWSSKGYDVTNRGELLYDATEEFEPNSYEKPSSYITLKEYEYDQEILSNGVFVNDITTVTTNNTETGVETTSINTYDEYHNVATNTTNFPGGSTKRELTYNNIDDLSYYYIGVLLTEINTRTLGSSSFSTRNIYGYDYSNLNLSVKVTYNNNDDSIAEFFEYDSFGNVTEKTLRADGMTTRVTSYAYDSTGRFLDTSTDIDGFVTDYNFNTTTGNLDDVTDYVGRTTSYEYDGWNRVTKETDYLGVWTETSYFDSTYTGRVYIRKISSLRSDGTYFQEEAINRSGNVYYSYYRNEFGTQIKKSIEYDAIGRIKRESEPYTSSATDWTYYYYDQYNRPLSTTMYNGENITYDYSGLTTSVTDSNQTRTQTTDAIGNVVNVSDDGGSIDYTYFANGVPETTTYSNGNTITTKIDGWGRKTELVDPAAGTYTYAYDNFGQISAETTPKGTSIYEYDDGGRILSTKTSGSGTSTDITYTYNDFKMPYITSVKDYFNGTSLSYSYAYDEFSRPISINESGSNGFFAKGITYDDYGRVDTEGYSTYSFSKLGSAVSSIVVQNLYSDTSAQLIGIKDLDSGTVLWEANSVNEYGAYTSLSLGNGITKSRQYDEYGFPELFSDTDSNGNSALNITYDFDAKTGNLNSRTNSFFTGQEVFKYDSQDRLTEISGAMSHTTQYHNNGNIDTNSNVGTYNYNLSSAYQVSGISLNDTGESYYQEHSLQRINYNAFKKPLEIYEAGNGRVDFEYDAFMNRHVAYYGGDAEDKNDRDYIKLYSSLFPIEVIKDNINNTSKVITYLEGDAYSAPLAFIKTSDAEAEFVYIHRDHLGSVMAITDEDANIIEQTHYGAWGTVEKYWDTKGNETLGYDSILGRGYTGHEHFTSVSLIHMNGRMYDPNLGRFLSPDNYVQEPFNTQSFNRYAYVFNNPLKYNDPSGEMSANCPDCPSGPGWDWTQPLPTGPPIQITPDGWEKLKQDLGPLHINDWLDNNLRSIDNDLGLSDAVNFVEENILESNLLNGAAEIVNDIGEFFGIKGIFRTKSTGSSPAPPKITKTYFNSGAQSFDGSASSNTNVVDIGSRGTYLGTGASWATDNPIAYSTYSDTNGNITNVYHLSFDPNQVTYLEINPFFGPGGAAKAADLVYKATRVVKGLKVGNVISVKQAISRLKSGKDIYTANRSLAKQITKKAGGKGKVIKDPAHGKGYFEHFHDKFRKLKGHSFFGSGK